MTRCSYSHHLSALDTAQDSVLTVHKNPGATFAPATLMTFSIRGKLEIWKHDLNACGVSRASLLS